jgi:hypothetical protein
MSSCAFVPAISAVPAIMTNIMMATGSDSLTAVLNVENENGPFAISEVYPVAVCPQRVESGRGSRPEIRT